MPRSLQKTNPAHASINVHPLDDEHNYNSLDDAEESEDPQQHKIFIGYSEKPILNVFKTSKRCEAKTSEELVEAKNAAGDEVLVMIAEENAAFPRHALYIVQDDKDFPIITDIMNRNNEKGTWYTVPKKDVGLMIENYNAQIQSCCDSGAAFSYPAAYLAAAAMQVAIFKLVADWSGDIRIAFAISPIVAFGAMFYLQAAYTGNLFNQKRVEFNPGTFEAQSIFVNSVSLAEFKTKSYTQTTFALGTPITALSISADVGLSVTKLSHSSLVGGLFVLLKTIEDLLTNALRAVEQRRLVNPVMGPANELPGLKYAYRSSVGQAAQKGFIFATPLLVSGTYAYAAYKLLELFMEKPAFYLQAISGILGLAASFGSVFLYSLYELGAAERNVARQSQEIPEDSNLRVFQRIGKAQSRNASNSLLQKIGYTFFHTAAQGPTIGVGIAELVMAFEPELSGLGRGGILLFGLAISLLLTLSKNKRVFEQPTQHRPFTP